jgi:hypothetical protein
MKTTFIILALLTSFAFAHESDKSHKHNKGEMKEERFAKMKERALDNINKRMEQMEKAKKCIQNANDREALKGCRENAREHFKEMKGKRKERREKRKARRSQEDND